MNGNGNYSSSIYNLEGDDLPKNKWAWIDFPMLAPLAYGIVRQAAEDYYNLKAGFPLVPMGAETSVSVREIENFFHSQWYEQLVNIDPDYMLKKLEEKVENTVLRYDVRREKGSNRYYIYRVGDDRKRSVDRFYDNKQKALRQAAKLNDMSTKDYMRLRKRDSAELD